MSKSNWLTRFIGGGIASASEADEPIDFAAVARMAQAAEGAPVAAQFTAELRESGPSAELIQAQAELAAAKAELTKAQAELAKVKAAAPSVESLAKDYAAKAVAESRILPAQAEALEQLYLSMVDAQGLSTETAARLDAFLAGLPKHSLTTEFVKSGAAGVADGHVLANDETKVDPSRIEALLRLTPFGETLIKR